MSSIQRIGTLLSAILGAQLVACSGSTPTDSRTMAQAAPDTISRTVVRIQPDGTRNVITSIISREEQLLEISRKQELELAAAYKGERLLDIVTDPGCAASSMWLFSNTNMSGNEWCVFQDGNNLSPYGYYVYLCDINWAGMYSPSVCGHILSAWGGSDVACLADDANDGYGNDFTNFNAFEANDQVDASKTDYLYIGIQCRSHIG